MGLMSSQKISLTLPFNADNQVVGDLTAIQKLTMVLCHEVT